MQVRSHRDDGDIRGAIRAHGRAWREAYDGILPPSVLEGMPVEPTDRLVREWRERIDADRGVFLVAADADDAVQGYAYTRWREDTKAFVGDGEAGLKEIYVHPDAWGEGVGTALLDAVVERLPDDVTALKAEMLADNVVGERFYERREFERVATGSTEIAGHRYPVVVYALPLGE